MREGGGEGTESGEEKEGEKRVSFQKNKGCLAYYWLIQDVNPGNLAPEGMVLITAVCSILQVVPLMEKKWGLL